MNGTVNGTTSWVLTSQVTTVGTDPLTFTKFSINPTTIALTSNPLSQFASTTSLQLLGVMSDETGTGALVFANTPTLVTPVLGAATATSINGNTFTTGTYTLTGVAGKTLTFNKSITLEGTDATTMTFPTTSATIARTDAANTFTGASTATSWTFTTPVLGTPTSGTLTNCTGTADGLTAGDVTRNHAVYAAASPPTVDVGIFTIAKTSVDLKTAATVDVFTVPASRTFICTSTYILVTAVTTGGAGTQVWTIKESSSARAMSLGTTSASGTPVANQTCYLMIGNASPVNSNCTAGNKVQCVFGASHAGSTAVTGTVYVTGFYSS